MKQIRNNIRIIMRYEIMQQIVENVFNITKY